MEEETVETRFLEALKAMGREFLSRLFNEFGSTLDEERRAAALGFTVLEEIGIERQRQIDDEGWHLGHDDTHTLGELARAAAAYAMPTPPWDAPAIWPWRVNTFKRKDRRRDLIRAGALIVAEIERLDRKAERDNTTPSAALWTDLGVTRLGRRGTEDREMARVVDKPHPGQYRFDEASGAYTFSPEDLGRWFRIRCVPPGEGAPLLIHSTAEALASPQPAELVPPRPRPSGSAK